MAKRKKQPKIMMADNADKHELYQAAVQCSEFEIAFYEDRFRDLRGKRRKPKILREDFCGTAMLSTDWCKSHPKRRAIGVDLCVETLQWGADKLIEPSGASVKRRVTLLNENVKTVRPEAVDLICAMNFSYCVFKTRKHLGGYFKNAFKGLKKDGLFFLDLMGGTATIDVNEEEKYLDDHEATYIWEHESFNPITNDIVCHIHFEFDDGSRIDKAFSYEWRLWSLPEIQELLIEAGFSSVHIYWEEFVEGRKKDEYLTGTGNYREVSSVDQQESWLAYIVAAV